MYNQSHCELRATFVIASPPQVGVAISKYLAPKPVLSKVEGFIWGFYCGFTAGFISPQKQPMNTEKKEN